MKFNYLVAALLSMLFSGCAVNQMAAPSTTPLTATSARVLIDNDAAFLSKLRLVEQAKSSIDMMYYIYADDYSSSALSQALINAAGRGVKVRLLVDYHTNYKRLDLFSLLERDGGGNIQVRFYNRPTRNIVQNAVYITMGCGPQSAAAGSEACSSEKYAAIDQLFANEMIEGKPAAERNISNLNIGNSGLFLSGLYGKRPDLMALAVQQGQNLKMADMKGSVGKTGPEEKEKLAKLGQTYWKARTAPLFERLEANATLFFAFALYGEQLDPIRDTVTGSLPVGRQMTAEAVRDWDHLTDFLHHKLILVDRSKLQMGGRNVEDSYHMNPSPMARKYLFMDTDLYAELPMDNGQLAAAFEDVWNFTSMVATVAEVRQHAPNDVSVNKPAMEKADEACLNQGGSDCFSRQFQEFFRPLEQRLSDLKRELEENSRRYHMEYLAGVSEQSQQSFAVDAGAVFTYFENTPFNRSLPAAERTRTYGARAGQESESGKNITGRWLQSIDEICSQATPANPASIILHNAYFFPPANLTYALSQLATSERDCSNVTVTVLTNSIETTDLNVVNLAARHSLKAFTELYQQQSDPARRARFEYWEYQPQNGHPNLSLHSKVTILGKDIMIGSANADVRSFYMDSNNAMLVANAPELVSEYRGFIRKILSEPGRARMLNDYFAATSRETMLQEDLQTFRQIMAKYGVDKKLPQESIKVEEARFVQLLNDVYRLTKDAIDPALTAGNRNRQQDTFNGRFKPI